MSRQKAIEITQKLYQCREQQIFLSGEEGFKNTFIKWSPVVLVAMEKFQCSEIEALIKLLDLAQGKADEGMLMHVLNAVVCEMCEPSVTKEQQ